MAPPLTEITDIRLQLTTHLSIQKGLSWPGWLTYSGWITHISGHPSATGRAQDRESLLARDQRSTAVLCSQPTVNKTMSTVQMTLIIITVNKPVICTVLPSVRPSQYTFT